MRQCKMNAMLQAWPKGFESSKDLGLIEGLHMKSVLWFGGTERFQAKIHNGTRAR